MFFRQLTDGTRIPVNLQQQFAGPIATPCWIIGGGPSLTQLPVEEISRLPAPTFGLNLAGTGLLRPTFWTSYDPTERFHRSTYLDPAVMKFVHTCRANDLIPETTFKVCEAPSLYFFERNKQAGFGQFPSQSATVTDWQDTLIQSIDLAYQLGFRTLYLAGCEMWIPPSSELRELAGQRGLEAYPFELLGDFVKRCEQAGVARSELDRCASGRQYHFDEQKPLAAAIQTDFHYFRVAQYLRLCRRSMALAGLNIISVTPESRLNDHFPIMEASAACAEIRRLLGDPAREVTQGRYTGRATRGPQSRSPMRDFRPHHWPAKPSQSPPAAPPEKVTQKKQKLSQFLEQLEEIPVDLNDV